MLTIGFGTVSEYSRNRVPRPPQNRTTFIPASSRVRRASLARALGVTHPVPFDRPAQASLQWGGRPPAEDGIGPIEAGDPDVAARPVRQRSEPWCDRRIDEPHEPLDDVTHRHRGPRAEIDRPSFGAMGRRGPEHAIDDVVHIDPVERPPPARQPGLLVAEERENRRGNDLVAG